MKLYIVRHGQAASSDADPRRPLTAEGRRQVGTMAAFLKRLQITVDCIWHSGKTRAEQTAEILAEAMTAKDGPAAHAGLAPNDEAGPIRDEIESAGQDVMIIGHLPFVSRLASLLLTGSDTGNPIAFKEATIACLEKRADDHWQIEWVVAPESLGCQG